eukprot:SM001747S03327  [mRNA]  locus=s1747:170:1757:- [translate_table: standard]
MCERSLSYAKGGATMPVVPPFVRAEMLPSGVLARPYIGGGCSLILLDHYDLKPKESQGRTRHACTQPASVLDVLRPLYESPAELADRVTIKALRYLAQRNDEPAGSQGAENKQRTAWGVVADRIVTGFDEAVNGFEDGGWLPLPGDGLDDVTVAVRPVPSPLADSIPPNGTPLALVEAAGTAGILCAKACMRLMNIPPVQLLQYLREHRAEWARPLAGTAPPPHDGGGALIQTPASATLLPSVLYAVDVNETLELVRDDSAVAGGEGNGRTAHKLLLQAWRFLHLSPTFLPSYLTIAHLCPSPSRPPLPPPLAPLAP